MKYFILLVICLGLASCNSKPDQIAAKDSLAPVSAAEVDINQPMPEWTPPAEPKPDDIVLFEGGPIRYSELQEQVERRMRVIAEAEADRRRHHGPDRIMMMGGSFENSFSTKVGPEKLARLDRMEIEKHIRSIEKDPEERSWWQKRQGTVWKDRTMWSVQRDFDGCVLGVYWDGPSHYDSYGEAGR